MKNVYEVKGIAATITKVTVGEGEAEHVEEQRSAGEDVALRILAEDDVAAGSYAEGYISATKDKKLFVHLVHEIVHDVLDSDQSIVDPT